MSLEHGFQKGKGTVDVISQFVERVRHQERVHHHEVGIFIDFLEAFDSIDHKIIIIKPEKYQVSEAFPWNGSAFICVLVDSTSDYEGK